MSGNGCDHAGRLDAAIAIYGSTRTRLFGTFLRKQTCLQYQDALQQLLKFLASAQAVQQK